MEAIIQTRVLQVFIFHLWRRALGFEASPSALKRLQPNSRGAAPKGRCLRLLLLQGWSWEVSVSTPEQPRIPASPEGPAQPQGWGTNPAGSPGRAQRRQCLRASNAECRPSPAPLALEPNPRESRPAPALPSRFYRAEGQNKGQLAEIQPPLAVGPGPAPHGISPSGRARCRQRRDRGFQPRAGRARSGWVWWALWVLPDSEYSVILMDSCPIHRPMTAALRFLPFLFLFYYSFRQDERAFNTSKKVKVQRKSSLASCPTPTRRTLLHPKCCHCPCSHFTQVTAKNYTLLPCPTS